MRQKPSREREVVPSGDAEHGVLDPVALETALAEDLQVFMRATTCSTRARTRLCERPCSRCQPSNSSPRARRWCMRRPAPGQPPSVLVKVSCPRRPSRRTPPMPAVVAIAGQAVGRRLRVAERWRELAQCWVRAPVSDCHQHPVLRRQTPRPTLAPGSWLPRDEARSPTCRRRAGSTRGSI